MDDTPPPALPQGGITISAPTHADGDIVGRDKIIGYTADQVNVLLTRFKTEFQSKPFTGQSPYVGLAAFQETDAARFFGRETLIAELVTRLTPNAAAPTARALFVAGPSGSGKSSLIRAGLIPALKNNALAGSANWLYETMKPGRAPLDELGRVTAGLALAPDARKDIQTRGLTDPTILHQWADLALKDDSNRRAVIFLDQFEEVFTQVAQETERVSFLQQLNYAATVPNGRVLLLFALRSDFVSNCASYPDLNALLNQQFLQVGAMTPDELVSAIARPALEVGLKIDPALIAQIVNDVRGEPGALPLMQFALQDLFEAQKAQGELTLDGYLARGGLNQALERHADTEFQKLNDSDKQLARTVFSGLIEIGRGTQDTKRTALFTELVPAGTDVAHVQTLIHELADARLITTDEQAGQETVTLAHEKLIDAWEWLRRLVNENREAIALQNNIAEDAREWDKQKRDPSYLYTGGRLATAREQLAEQKITLSGPAQEFIDAGITAHEAARAEREAMRQRELDIAKQIAQQAIALTERERERAVAGEQARHEADKRVVSEKQRSRILRFAAIGLSGLLLVAILTSAFAFQQRNNADQQARVAESRRLAAQSGLSRTEDLNVSLLLGVESVKLDPNFEARNNLLTALQETQQVTSFYGHTGVNSVAFSPDSKTLASGSGDKTIRLWDVATGKPFGTPLMGHTSDVNSVVFSPDGKTLASASADKTIRLWDLATGKPLGTPLIGHTNAVNSVAFSPDGKILASASADKTIRLWDLATGKPLGTPLTGHRTPVESVAFSPDGKILASASADKTIRLWDVATGKQLGTPLTGHTNAVWSVAFSPDSKILASGSQDKTIRLWDVPSGKPLGTPLAGHTDAVNSVAFSPDGKILASGSQDMTIRLWDVATGKPLGTPLAGHTDAVWSVAFSPDGKTLASGSGDKTIRLWDVATGKPLGTPLTGHTDAVWSVAFSPDGKILASGSQDKTIRLWDLATGKPLGTPLMGHTDWVSSVAFSPDGKILASASTDMTIRLWDVATGKPLGTPLTGHTAPVGIVAFSPDGKILASASADKTIRLWDLATGKPLGTPLMGYKAAAFSVAFSSDGKILASASADKTIRLWDVATGKPLGTPLMGLRTSVESVAFSPDGKNLASASADKTIRLWDVATGKPLGTPLTGYMNAVDSVAFSLDGKFLASGSQDMTIQLWDVATRKPLGIPLTGHTDFVSSVAFSPDGKTLASGSGDKTIRLWEASPEAWQARACLIVNRNLTRAEWDQYFNHDPLTYDTIYAKNPTCPNLPIEPQPTPTPSPTP